MTTLYSCPKCGCAMEPPTVETMDVRLAAARAEATDLAYMVKGLQVEVEKLKSNASSTRGRRDKDTSEIAKLFVRVGGFGVDQRKPVATLIAFAYEWHTKWQEAAATADKLAVLVRESRECLEDAEEHLGDSPMHKHLNLIETLRQSDAALKEHIKRHAG